MAKRDRTAYERLWEAVIRPAITRLESEETRCRSTAKEDIWNAYGIFNLHASENYMRKSVGRLDRHKVAACYTYAVMAAMPLVVDEKHLSEHLNERVALVTGCSVLANFLSVAIARSDCFTVEEAEAAQARLREGVRFPNPVGHGTYVDGILNALTFTQIEKNYNILLLALLFYDWEAWLLNPDDHKKVVDYYRQSSEV